jgi:Peptidase family M23
MTLVFILQFVVPLFFIGWTVVLPAKSVVGILCQAIGVAFGLFALALIGLWLFPPWWTPYSLASLWGLAVFLGWRRRTRIVSKLPSGWLAWVSTALFITVGGWGAYQSASAIAGRTPRGGAVVDLLFPFKAGTYLVVSGGSSININPHLMTLDASMVRFRAYKGQSYGVDIVKLDGWGLRANGLQPTEPSAYNIYGMPVFAPCTGEVVAAEDSLPDMQVPIVDREHMAGNFVLLRCKDADVLLGHFKPRSLRVTIGSQVSVGSQIAQVGNTGNTSEPHLHLHAQERGTTAMPISGNPLPIRLNGRYLVRNDRVTIP